MSDYLEDVEKTLATLTKSSRQSITMIAISAVMLVGSVVYSATRLAPLEREMQSKRDEIASLERTQVELNRSVEASRAELAGLRGNIEELYAVKVTDDSTIYELRASARATDRTSDQGPIYQFEVFINASKSTLEAIKEVTYSFNHPTFRKKTQTSADVSNNFTVGYLGWGCLTSVTAKMLFHSGEQSEMKFNMCKSLGPQWWNEESDQNPVPEGGDEAIEKITRKRPINEQASKLDSPIQKMAVSETNTLTSDGTTSKTPPRESCGLQWASGNENPCPDGCYMGREVQQPTGIDTAPSKTTKLQRRQFECWREG